MLSGLLDTPAPTPTEEVVEPWTYDGHGILRVEQPRTAWPAAVLTWLRQSVGQQLSGEDLQRLKNMDPEEIAGLQLTTPRPPLYLAEARFPADLSLLDKQHLPVLIQTDNSSTRFGPWSVLVSVEAERAILHDPRRGRIEVPRAGLEDHLAGIVVPFFDRERILGLKPGDDGPRVRALQEMLREAGYYNMEPSGVYDEFTRSVVERFREKEMLPGGPEIGPMLAFELTSREKDSP